MIRTKYELLEADQIIADGEKLAAKQRGDMASEYDRLNQRFNGDLLNLKSGIGDALQARAQGIIPDDTKLKEVLDKMGQDYNALGDKANAVTDSISIYSEQAARNMQSAFADFLFDPFGKGIGGMGEAFAKTVQKMAADAAAAQIMTALFGKSGDGGGGIFGTIFSGLFSAVAGSLGGGGMGDGGLYNSGTGLGQAGPNYGFANGGIMTSAGPLPLHKYAMGGIANKPQVALFGEGRMNEAYVPLPDGRSIPVSMSGNSGNTYNVQISVDGGRSPDETGQRVGEAFIRTIARDEISNQTRAGNRLNPTTRF